MVNTGNSRAYRRAISAKRTAVVCRRGIAPAHGADAPRPESQVLFS